MNMKTNARSIAIAALLLFAGAAAFAQDKNDILKKIDAKMNPENFEAYRTIVDLYPDGRKKEFSVYTVKKGVDRTAMLFLEPASEKGKTTLRVGDNMWLYIPKVGRPVRITSLQSVTGGIFNNADIMQIDYAVEYDVTASAPDGDGLVLELKAKTRAVAYDKLTMRVARDAAIRSIECYSASGMLIKTIEFGETRDFGNGITRPAVMETTSPLYKGYRSTITYTRIRPKTLPDEVFTMNYMPRLEALRK